MCAGAPEPTRTERLLCGMLPGVIREQAHVRHSNEAARRAGYAGSELLADWGRLVACSNKVSTITSAVVDDVEVITAHQRHLYHELTSAQMLASVDGHLGVLLSLLGAPCLSADASPPLPEKRPASPPGSGTTWVTTTR